MSLNKMLQEITESTTDIRTYGRRLMMTQDMALREFQAGALDDGMRLSISLDAMRAQLDSMSPEDVTTVLNDIFDWSDAILDYAYDAAIGETPEL